MLPSEEFNQTVWRVFHYTLPGFPLTLEKLENLEKWEKFFQSGKSQGILKFYQKVREFYMSQGKVREN